MTLFFVVLLLAVAFLVHVVWWRIKLPANATKTLLLIFTLTPLVLPLCLQLTDTEVSTVDLFRILLLYTSSALVYIILFSAVEMQSPTLAIVDMINQCGDKGCDMDALRQAFLGENEMQLRLDSMYKGGWLQSNGDNWMLTTKGRRIANLFEYSAIIFCLSKGG